MNSRFPQKRLRRLRKTEVLRSLNTETTWSLDNLIYPLFIKHGRGPKIAIETMQGLYQYTIETLESEINTLVELGITKFLLFGIPANKDPLGKDSYKNDGIVQTAIKLIKNIAPESLVIADLCLCQYTDHGHCGVVKNQQVDNDASLILLQKQAISYAKAGVDMVAPSASMDGMVQAIREALDDADFPELPILSYSVKYASNFYGPFRDAAYGAPKFGDRKTYQQQYTNSSEAILETELDLLEGADLIMVKPAHTYLDIIAKVKNIFPNIPLGAYHTSGEFAMIKTAAEQKLLDEKEAVFEVITAIKRAGADFIITYYAKQIALWKHKINS